MADSIEATLTSLIDVVRSCDPSSLNVDELRVATTAARQVQRSVDMFLGRVARRSNELAATGTGPSAEDMLLGNGDVSARQARAGAARATVTASLPSVATAAEAGRLGAEHLDVIARSMKHLDQHVHEAVVEQDTLIADAAASLPVDRFNKWFHRRLQVIEEDHGRERAKDQRARSEFRHWRSADGMGHFRGQLDPQRFDAFITAIDRHTRSLANTTNSSPEVADGHCPKLKLDGNLAAAAVCELVSSGNGRFGRSEIKVVVDAKTVLNCHHEHSICETSFGTPLPPETLDRYACTADIRRVTLDAANVELHVGRKHRTATEAHWAALTVLYATCAWYGCDRPIDWCQAHHVTTWEDLGPTELENLVPLCNQHHHAVHEGNWQLTLQPNRTLNIHTPSGTHWHTTQPNRLHPNQWPGTPTPQQPREPQLQREPSPPSEPRTAPPPRPSPSEPPPQRELRTASPPSEPPPTELRATSQPPRELRPRREPPPSELRAAPVDPRRGSP